MKWICQNNLIITEEKIPGLGNQLIIEQFQLRLQNF